MIARIGDMPPGTVGLRASGKLTRSDYQEVLEPALRDAMAAGEIRLLFVLPDFDGLEPSAWVADIKLGLEYEMKNRSAWKRLAFVTDVDWIRKALHTFAFLVPGELMVCELDELERARLWVAS